LPRRASRQGPRWNEPVAAILAADRPAATPAPEGQRIGDRLGPVAPGRLDRPSERTPFELHRDPPFERIEMLVEAVLRHQAKLGLNAMEQSVKHVLLTCLRIPAR
jgi:hypothetical protein